MSLKLNSSGGGSVTLQEPVTASTRTLTLPDNTGTVVSTASTGVVSQTMLASNVAGNGPAFLAYADGTQTAAISTYTKVLFPAETFDTANAFSSSTFTPLVAGYYTISCAVNSNQTSSASYLFIEIRKNNTRAFAGALTIGSSAEAVTVAGGVLYLNGSTDYVDVYVIQNAGTATLRNSCFVSGALVRAA